MRILVTGAEGQVARSLAEAAMPHRVVSIGRPRLDVTDPDSVRASVRAVAPDAVVNAAAYTSVDKAETDEEVAFAVNVGAGDVAAICAEAGIPIVHLSTDYVFDGRKTSPYVETDAPGPINVYGRTKLAAEEAVAASNPRYLIVRTAWVFSPYANNFVKTMLRLADVRSELAVVDDQIGSPTYAPHLADAILSMLSHIEASADQTLWGTYHAAGAGETSWCGLAREVFRVARDVGGPAASVRAITSAEYPTPATRPVNSRLDCGKLKSAFGIVLPHWTDGVAACVSTLCADQGPSITNPRSQ